MTEKKGLLEDIQTGYEEHYDFPDRRMPPSRTYVLASVPRTGSTYLSHLLWQSGFLGAPLEYLNFLPSGPYGAVSDDPQGQIELWRSVLRRRTSPNGVFGIKCFPTQMRQLQDSNAPLFMEVMGRLFPRDASHLLVQLKRRDRLAHAISYARAALSGVWRKEQEGAAGISVEFSAEAVDHARKVLDDEEANWARLFDMLKVEPFTLWYEDVLAQPDAVPVQVAGFLGVDPDPAAAVAVPQVEKQAEQDPHLWADLYQAANRP